MTNMSTNGFKMLLTLSTFVDNSKHIVDTLENSFEPIQISFQPIHKGSTAKQIK